MSVAFVTRIPQTRSPDCPAGPLLPRRHFGIRESAFVFLNPRVDHAFTLARPLLDDPTRGAALAQRGQTDVLRTHGNRAVGLRILARLQTILAESPHFNPESPAQVEPAEAKAKRKTKG